MNSEHTAEVASGDRFEFGENWTRFLTTLNEERIRAAEKSLLAMLRTESLSGKRFLDIGSGSGLFSLAARRLGAAVFSFDYDPKSVACTSELKRRYFDGDSNWTVTEGSVLDKDFTARLGVFDVVYSWGVLHHTGQMYEALSAASERTAANGQLFIAIYNDQRFISRYWLKVKRIYNRSVVGKIAMTVLHAPYLFGAQWLVRAATGRLARERGMSMWHDMFDWLGGYPFEVAKPETVFAYFRDRQFELENLITCGGRMGCNEFVFRKTT